MKLFRLLQKRLDLFELLDCLIGTGNIRESDLRILLVHQLGARLTEVHYSAIAALRTGHQEPEDSTDDDERKDCAKKRDVPRGVWVFVVVAVFEVGGGDGVNHLLTAEVNEIELNLFAIFGVGSLESYVDALVAFVDLHRSGLVGRDKAQTGRRVNLLELATRGERGSEHHNNECGENPDEWAFKQVLKFHSRGLASSFRVQN